MHGLVIDNLWVHHHRAGVTILREISLRLEAGLILGLLGPNASGKTTVLRCMAGLVRPANGGPPGGLSATWGMDERYMTGRILINGRDVHAVAPRDRGVSLVPQNLALYPDKTVLENIAFPLSCRGVARREAFRQAGALVTELGLEGAKDRRPSAISGGQQQRVAIGRALVAAPRLVLLDEPLASLDAPSRMEMLALLRDSLRRHGASAVYVTHDPREADELCDLVAFLQEGTLHQVASREEAHARPSTLFVASMYAGFVNVVPGHLGGGGLFAPQGGTGSWALFGVAPAVVGGDQSVLRLAGRPAAFRFKAGEHEGVKGTVVARIMREGEEFVRVSISDRASIVCRPAERLPEGTHGTVHLNGEASQHLRLCDASGSVL